jgi:hypothetical protein
MDGRSPMNGRGIETVELDPSARARMQTMVGAARAFYEMPRTVQALFKLREQGYIYGYRGQEDGDESRPNDLNKSMSYMRDQRDVLRRNGRLGRILRVLGAEEKHRYEALEAACDEMLDVYTRIASRIVCELLSERDRRLDPSPFLPAALAHHSWIQLNYLDVREVHETKRKMVQFVHKDGHLLTIGSSDKPGLELVDAEEAQRAHDEPAYVDEVRGLPAELGFDRATVFLGDITTELMRGDAEGGVDHQVRFYPGDDRLAPIFFANPYMAPGRALRRWDDPSKAVDLAKWAVFQNRFGVPTICSDPEASH